MLALQAFSTLTIFLLFLLPGHGSILHIDQAQLLLSGVTPRQIRGGLVLAIFAFVGFESAASLGAEAVNPLRTIPRTICLTIVICGLRFATSAYAETIALKSYSFGSAPEAPLKVLAVLRGYPAFGPILLSSSLISAFSGVIACILASSRALYRMSQNGECVRVLVCDLAHDQRSHYHPPSKKRAEVLSTIRGPKGS
jgi:amino acid transporter